MHGVDPVDGAGVEQAGGVRLHGRDVCRVRAVGGEVSLGGVARVQEVGGSQRMGGLGEEPEHGTRVDVGDPRDERGERLQRGDHGGGCARGHGLRADLEEHDVLDRGGRRHGS